jgi:branched-chain amino acid transport system ATP-binding protein
VLVGRVFAILNELRDKGVTIVLIEQNAKARPAKCPTTRCSSKDRPGSRTARLKILNDPRIAQLFLGGGLATTMMVALPESWTRGAGNR